MKLTADRLERDGIEGIDRVRFAGKATAMPVGQPPELTQPGKSGSTKGGPFVQTRYFAGVDTTFAGL